jgi:hypothetical protein
MPGEACQAARDGPWGDARVGQAPGASDEARPSDWPLGTLNAMPPRA